MRRSSTTSFAVRIEPSAQPRLAALSLLLHLFAAACPWLMHCPGPVAAGLTLTALLALAATIARVPGSHCHLRGLAYGTDGWQARLAGSPDYRPVALGGATRAYAGLVYVEIVADGRKRGWLLPRTALLQADFRRLKAVIRLSC